MENDRKKTFFAYNLQSAHPLTITTKKVPEENQNEDQNSQNIFDPKDQIDLEDKRKKNTQIQNQSQNFPNQYEPFQCRLKDWLRNLVKNKIFQYIYIFLLLIFLVECVLYGSLKEEEAKVILQIVEKIIQSFFLLCSIVKIISGEIDGKTWIIIDLVSTISSIIGFSLLQHAISRYFLALRTIKLLLLIKCIGKLFHQLQIFARSLRKACTVVIPAICLIYIYAAIGLYSFLDLEHNKCRDPINRSKKQNWTVYTEEVFLCGERDCPIVNGIQYECLNPIFHNVTTNPQELMNMKQGQGILHFANIGYSLLSTLKQTFITGSSRLILLYKDAVNQIFVKVYFYSFIYLISYIYLNIFFGLMIAGLEEEKKQNQIKFICQSQQQSQKNIERDEQKPDTFQIELAEIKQKEKKKTLLKMQSKYSLNIYENNKVINSSQENKTQEENHKQAEENITDITRHIKCRNFFNVLITLLICFVLSLQYENQPASFQFVVDCFDFVLFVLAFLLLLFSLWIEKKYAKKIEITTMLDVGVIGLALVGIIYEGFIAKSFYEFLKAETTAAEVFRTFKYLKIIIIILQRTYWAEGHRLLMCIIRSVYKVRHIIFIWILIMVILTLMGYHLHTGNTLVNENGQIDLQNGKPHQISFTDVYHSFIFTILTVYDEEWDYLMFQQYPGSGICIVLWQLFIMIIGFIILSKYFMSLLAEELDATYEQCQHKYEKEKCEDFSDSQSPIQEEMKKFNQIVPLEIETVIKERTKKLKEDIFTCENIGKKIKKVFMAILGSLVFQILKVLFIVVNYVALVYSTPNSKPNQNTENLVFILNLLSFLFFLFQTIANLTVQGFSGANSYFKKSYLNIFNIILLIVELLSLTPLSSFYVFQKISKIKVFRCIFFIEKRYKKDKSMKIMIRSLFQLIPKILSLLFLTLLIYYYFALVLTKVYKEDGYYCENAYNYAKISTKEDCFNWGGNWVRYGINFSNVLNSLIALFYIGTMEGWIMFMKNMMNFNGANQVPSYNANENIQVFFVFFFFIGNMIIINSFISLSLINFKRIKEKETGEEDLNEMQKIWLRVKIKIQSLVPQKKQVPPQNAIRFSFYRFASHSSYSIIKGVIFILFLVFSSFYHSQMSEQIYFYLQIIQKLYFIIMAIQFIIEMVAFGYHENRKKEFIFEVISFLYVLTYLLYKWKTDQYYHHQYIDRSLGGLFMFFQIFRYLKLLNKIPYAHSILDTIFKILPSTVNILLLIIVTLLIYSIIGIQLFCFLKHNNEIDQYNQNYETFGSAIFALIKFSTLESPIEQIKDAAQQSSPNFLCFQISNYEEFQKYGQNGCGSALYSYLFFFSFHIIYSLFLMSTLIASIVDSYSDIRRLQNSSITSNILNKVVETWADLDPEGKGYIYYRQLWRFSYSFLKIYSEIKDNNQENIKQLFTQKKEFLRMINLPVYECQEGIFCFKFHDVIQNITKLFLEKKFGYHFQEKRSHLFYEKFDHQSMLRRKQFTSAHVPQMILLKAGLRIWKMKSTNKGSYLMLNYFGFLEDKEPQERKMNFMILKK